MRERARATTVRVCYPTTDTSERFPQTTRKCLENEHGYASEEERTHRVVKKQHCRGAVDPQRLREYR